MLNKMMKKFAKGTAIVTAAACMMTAVPVQAMAEEIEMCAPSDMEGDFEDMEEEAMEDAAEYDEAPAAEEGEDEEESIVVADDFENDEEGEEEIGDGEEEISEDAEEDSDDLFFDENAEEDEKLAAVMTEDQDRRDQIDELIEGLDYDPFIVVPGESVSFKKKEGYTNGDKYVLVTRERHSLNNTLPDIAMIDANKADIYPGALLIGDSRLADGTPTPLAVLDRGALDLTLNINGGGGTITVPVGDKGSVQQAITDAVSEWASQKKATSAAMEYEFKDVYSEAQLSAELGIKADKLKLDIDFEDVYNSKKQCVVLKCNQIYYSVSTAVPGSPATLFGPTTTADYLKKRISDDKPPVEVTNVSYGRTYYLVFTTDSKSNNFKAAISAAINGVDISGKAEYKEICENTSFSARIIGGSAKGAAEILAGGAGLEAIKKVGQLIKDEASFEGFEVSAAEPVAYATSFVKDGARANVNMATEYVVTTAETFGKTSVHLDTAYTYALKETYLKAKKIIDWNDDGTPIFGETKTFMHDTDVSCNKDFVVEAGYGDYEFGYDIRWGTDWPYRGVFYSKPCQKINIKLRGCCRTPSCMIDVDGSRVIDQ